MNQETVISFQKWTKRRHVTKYIPTHGILFCRFATFIMPRYPKGLALHYMPPNSYYITPYILQHHHGGMTTTAAAHAPMKAARSPAPILAVWPGIRGLATLLRNQTPHGNWIWRAWRQITGSQVSQLCAEPLTTVFLSATRCRLALASMFSKR